MTFLREEQVKFYETHKIFSFLSIAYEKSKTNTITHPIAASQVPNSSTSKYTKSIVSIALIFECIGTFKLI